MSCTRGSPSCESRRRLTASYSYRPCCALVVDLMCHSSSGTPSDLRHLHREHGLAGARLALDQQRPLQRDRGVDRERQVVGGDVVGGACESHCVPENCILIAAAFARIPQPRNSPQKNDVPTLAACRFSRRALAQPALAQQKAEPNVAMCIGCHGIPGYRTAYPERLPRAEDRRAAARLHRRPRSRPTSRGERTHPSMRGIAASLTRRGHGRTTPTTTEGAANEGAAGDPRARGGGRRAGRGQRGLGQGEGGASVRRLPRRRRRQALDPGPADPRRPALRLPRAGAQRLQDRRAHQSRS